MKSKENNFELSSESEHVCDWQWGDFCLCELPL